MWNCGASILSRATRITPSTTCTKIDTCVKAMNHQSARERNETQRWAASAQTPASPLPMMTNHAHALWASRTNSENRRCARWSVADGRDGAGLAALCLGERVGGDVDEIGDLVVGEPGEAAEVPGQMDRVLLLLAPESAEAEQLVD